MGGEEIDVESEGFFRQKYCNLTVGLLVRGIL
jgi:hypothetical protein